MKCTNRTRIIRLLCVFCVAALFATGCGKSKATLPQEYNAYSYEESILNETVEVNSSYFAEDLCVIEPVNFGMEKIDSQVAHGAGAFNVTTNEVLYNQNIFDQLYPASTTKILTAYIILRDCNLSSVVTVSAQAAEQEPDSSVAGLKDGDTITVHDLLYGLMLASGNDAAEALAEFHSGSVEAFAEEMNATALALGATGSNFKNPSGLPDKQHYTTVYDMYLIFSKALEYPEFKEIISSQKKSVVYTSRTGQRIERTYYNTNKFMTGEYPYAKKFTLVGGKTGTTGAAKYCLVLLSENPAGDDIITIVYKADCAHNLYLLHRQILSNFAK